MAKDKLACTKGKLRLRYGCKKRSSTSCEAEAATVKKNSPETVPRNSAMKCKCDSSWIRLKFKYSNGDAD